MVASLRRIPLLPFPHACISAGLGDLHSSILFALKHPPLPNPFFPSCCSNASTGLANLHSTNSCQFILVPHFHWPKQDLAIAFTPLCVCQFSEISSKVRWLFGPVYWISISARFHGIHYLRVHSESPFVVTLSTLSLTLHSNAEIKISSNTIILGLHVSIDTHALVSPR